MASSFRLRRWRGRVGQMQKRQCLKVDCRRFAHRGQNVDAKMGALRKRRAASRIISSSWTGSDLASKAMYWTGSDPASNRRDSDEQRFHWVLVLRERGGDVTNDLCF